MFFGIIRKMSEDLFEISVVIPVFNGEKFIARAIDSVLAQTHPAREIIVVDDGSTDNTAEIVKSFGGTVKYLLQKNSGPGAARNLGIRTANSVWVTFLDADDEFLPHKLEIQNQFLKSNPGVVWCAGRYLKKTGDGLAGEQETNHQAEKYIVYQDYFQATLANHHAWTGTVVAKKKVLTKCGMFREGVHYGEDLDLWWRLAYSYPIFGYCTEPLSVYYMDIEGSLACHRNTFDQEDSFLKRHLALALEKGCQDRFKPVASYRVNSWLKSALFDKRITEIHLMLRQYGDCISVRQRWYYWLLAVWPQLTLFLTTSLSNLNRKFKFRKKAIHLRA